jgi:sulfur transfer complex TusBCD TusB component (DsrH family)
MEENVIKIPANNNEINLCCFLGEAVLKTQMVEQALSHSITLKMNPEETKERADEFLKQNQSYTLGHAIKIGIKEKLYNLSLQDELNAFLQQRNWLVHNVICGNEEDLNARNIKEELLDKIKAISDKAVSIQRVIEYDLIDFCSSKGKDMSETLAFLELQEQGVRIRK